MKIIKKRIWGMDDFYGPKHKFRQNKMISSLNKVVRRGTILDAGCGKGEQSLKLLHNGFDVVAVELNDENLNHFKKQIQGLRKFHSKLKIIKSSLEDLKLEKESLDAILCGEVLEHVEDDDRVLRNFNLFLKEGGHCIITSPLNLEY
jgi:2-polyprenyl-3-methyl-5-hydroxy-6-metoxy-1,4-benzoquinol methylase